MKDYFIDELNKWRSDYPELDFLSIKLLQYQNLLEKKEINKEEFDILIENLTDLSEIENKLEHAIEQNRIEKALNFFKEIVLLGAKAVPFL